MAKDNLPVFLKAIHIQGFKSFADRVKLELGQGLSVVVGPNGSGKSNVADAIRWVLGEQSAKSLRGTKMEDVIFAGSTQRRPVGMAEVSLVFDNSTGIFALDFQEVIITRRVYRDGDGQYFINKASCRLKDIQELFMDTGAGKEGFSIIGQGRVEEILNLKSEERRTLIEEAAGITKYRLRKKEALKRLEDTDHNLQRLNDILQEIEGQLAPLAAQAEVAEKSLALKADQHRVEIQLVMHDLAEVKQKLGTLAAEFEGLRDAAAAAAGDLAAEENENVQIKVRLNKLDEEIQRQQGEVYKVEQLLQTNEHELSLRAERWGHYAEQVSRLNQELVADEQKIVVLQGKLEAWEGKKAVLQATVDGAREKLANSEAKLLEMRLHQGLERIDDLKGELFAKLSEQADCANELAGIRQSLALLETQAQHLKDDLAQKNRELAELQAIVEQLNKDRQERADNERRLADLEEQTKAAFVVCQETFRTSTGELQEITRLADQARAKLTALRSLEESFEGYQRGVREILVAAKRAGFARSDGILGTVADLVTVNRKFEVAVETALGNTLQNVVTDDVETAKAAIAYLKERKLGWATFMPVDVMRGSRLDVSPVLTREPGFFGLAIDLINCADKFRPILEYLLGRVIIVDNMETGTKVAKAMGYKVRVVTLDGDQINAGGSLTGGSIQRKGSNLLGRSREIEEVEKNGQALDAERDRQQAECAALENELHGLREQLQSLTGQRRRLQEDQAVAKASLSNLLAQLSRLQEDSGLLKLRCQDVEAQQEEQQAKLPGYGIKAEQLESEIAGWRSSIQAAELRLKENENEISACQDKLTQDKIQLAKWEQELAQAKDYLAQEDERKLEQESLVQEKRQFLVAAESACRRVEQEQVSLRTQLEEQKGHQVKQYGALVQLRQERENISGCLIQLEEAVGKKRQSVQDLEQRLHRNEIQLARWEAEWESGLNRLEEEFALTWETGLSFLTERERGTLWTELKHIKQQLEELGPVNEAAIEEYPKMAQRYQFLENQRADLLEAEQTLHELLAELDKTMSERFKEGFDAVNTAFQDVFQELFCGGHAELRLVDPEHLLDTGVEIVAQPPGKKMQLLSLLSGGERSLTAIALLFALLRVKPSPFCLLDEIEASLDDANVVRFAQYIHRLAHSTQFIVISHRKGTMEEADVLYGIAMEESGVSKLLTVQLENKPA